jgi:hypothetical protein
VVATKELVIRAEDKRSTRAIRCWRLIFPSTYPELPPQRKPIAPVFSFAGTPGPPKWFSILRGTTGRKPVS